MVPEALLKGLLASVMRLMMLMTLNFVEILHYTFSQEVPLGDFLLLRGSNRLTDKEGGDGGY